MDGESEGLFLICFGCGFKVLYQSGWWKGGIRDQKETFI